jgi:hypothetical protein
MSLRFIEGFGAYSNAAHSDGAGDDLKAQWEQYTSVTINAFEADNNGTRKYATAVNGAAARPNLGAFSEDTFILGFRFYHTAQFAENLICRFLNSAGTLVSSIGIVAGRLVYSRDPSGDLGTSSAIVLRSALPVKPNQWHYLEMKVTLDQSAGAVAFQVNGQDAGSVSGVDTEQTQSGPAEAIEFASNLSSDWQTQNRITDIYVDDGTVFLGPMEVWYQEADASGTESGWTPLASTNESQVDEIGNDGDTTYNSSTTLQTDSLGTSKTLDADPIAIQPLVMARVVSPGSSTLRVGTKSDPAGTPTESFGATLGLVTTYDGVRGAIDEVDPDTAAAWTAANADAAEIMYEQVS